MRVLVMGGSRFNGRTLIESLLVAGHDVTTFNRGVTPVDLPNCVERLHGDRRDTDALRAALRGRSFDAVHDTSAYVLEDVRSAVEILLDRTGHYVFASSAAVYAPKRGILPVGEDDPQNPSELPGNRYGRNKAICENYLLEQHSRASFPVSITRYPMVYGPRNPNLYREALMFVRLLEGRTILLPGDGTTLSHMSYVRDQATALVAMTLVPRTFGQVYNLASTEYYSDEGYVDTLARIVGVEPNKIHLGSRLTDEAYACMPYPLMPRQGVQLVDWRENSLFSTRKFEAHVGYAQEHSLEQGMAETFAWFQHEGVRDRFEVDFAHEDNLLEKARAL